MEFRERRRFRFLQALQIFYTDKELRDFCGDIWYETSFFVPGELQGSIVELRFGAVAHRAEVYVNGEKRGFHEGGFVPFCVDVTDCVRYQEENRLVVLVNNELSDTSLPAGETEILKSGRKKAVPYFDFFNYSGIIRLCGLCPLLGIEFVIILSDMRFPERMPVPGIRWKLKILSRILEWKCVFGMKRETGRVF